MHHPTLLASALLCAAAIATSAFAAPPAYEAETSIGNAYKKPKGAWETATNWEQNRVPDKGDTAWVSHSTTVTLSTKAPLAYGVKVGGKAPSELTILDGAELRTISNIRVFRNIKETEAVLNIKGGYVQSGIDPKLAINAPLAIGGCPTYSGTGIVRISGGTYEGGIFIGSNLTNTGVGTLSVIGSAPTIRAKFDGRDALGVAPASTVEFIFDDKGVAPLDYAKSKVVFSEGSKLRIDGAAYQGKEQTIPLIYAKTLINKAQVEIVGFPTEKQAALVQTPKGLALKLKP